MSAWRTYKLGELAEITSSKRIFLSDYVREGVPFYRSKEVIERFKKQAVSTELYITKDKFNEIKKKFGVPEEGDILLTSVGTIGVPMLVRDTDYFYFKDGNLTWFRNHKTDILNPRYLYYWIQSSLGKQAIEQSKIGSTQQAITIVALKRIQIELPSLSEQSRIASILSSLDDKIELNLQMNKTLEAIAQAIFKEWFVDFRFPGFDDMLVDGLPKGWKDGVISDIYRTTSGGTPSRGREEYYREGTIRWVKSKELNGGFIFNTEEKITEEAMKKSSAKIIPKYSVLVAMYGATVGEHAILSKEATCNQAICAIIPNNNYSYTFILLHLRKNMNNIIDQSSGSAQQNISQALIQRQKIIIPPSELVKRFHKIVGPLFTLVENNFISNNTLSQIRDLLLPKLITGKIRV